jgi:hypothetical protein
MCAFIQITMNKTTILLQQWAHQCYEINLLTGIKTQVVLTPYILNNSSPCSIHL